MWTDRATLSQSLYLGEVVSFLPLYVKTVFFLNIPRRKLVPNLLYNSTYAVDGSYSKFIYIGLDYAVGYFRPVIGFGGHTGPDKYVIMDIESWDQLKTHFNTFDAYLCGRSEFPKHGKYAKIYLPHHDAELTNSYGSNTTTV